ncbi:hypothetical protein M407DRAFT_76368 [Tulasnella calospora MUT 4182]|uniref:DDH domain-containing protein n=1 Tax=Tulasnella calospora MUT 4182 TaxID=1051891 RepID=A0A0C3LU44_9AGAM|nr:hypothetical protein M407DRAFT_76368 [Tulasnella calospora MUT 4182]
MRDPSWPAPPSALENARRFLQKSARAGGRTILVPDKDADGLCGASIIYRTLVHLGHSPEDISTHLLQKGNNVHEPAEHAVIRSLGARYVIVVDQGSRGTRVTAEDDPAEVLIVDHHFSNEFPPGATVVNASHHEPVATSSLLAFIICQPLHRRVSESCDWLACMGTIGDLGSTFKWDPPFPDMSTVFKRYTKKSMTEAVSLINAPRRTATFDVISAWTAVNSANSPEDIISPSSQTSQRLFDARREINLEVERCSHTAPQFSSDGKVALLRMRSAAQVHSVVATRWAGHLKSSALEIVMVANEGYLPGLVNFSCRIARCAYARAGKTNSSSAPPVDIIELLKYYADRDQPAEGQLPLRQRIGDNFARGHKQASGGIVTTEHFEEFCTLMEIGVKKEGSGSRSPRKGKAVQKNTLDGYFKPKPKT